MPADFLQNVIPTAAQLFNMLTVAGMVLGLAAILGAIWALVDWAIDLHRSRVYRLSDQSDADRQREIEALRTLAIREARLSTPAAKGFDRRNIYQIHAADPRR